MNAQPKREAKLRQWLRKNKGDWHLSWIEPCFGSTVGAPDVMIIQPSGKLVLLELKWVGWRKDFTPRMVVRPEQGVWHRMAASRRVASGFLVGVDLPPGVCRAAAAHLTHAMAAKQWLEGYVSNLNCDWWVRRGWVAAVFSSAEWISAGGGVPRMNAVYGSSDLGFLLSRW